ncbi:hypothetical protein IE53DRAFT_160920 [Violaceomyces palustris]|uniref:Uncharacterized protein n=1 Tax=Violaceomyces palustris TaxID=1673888 RepID=A0ACD0NTN0_9BASI|nr:hypothetical protein IE53DRAFT_160920 [Violaceomyces palustris]
MASPSSNDVLGLLSAALSAKDPLDEGKYLLELYNLLKTQPGNIPILFPSLVSLLPRVQPTFKVWISQVMDLAFCRPLLGPEAKSNLAPHAPEAISLLLRDSDKQVVKTAAQCFASIYQILFRISCTDRSKATLWRTVDVIKAQLFHLFESGPQGVKLAVIKCFQRIIQTQSRTPADPRSSQLKNDVNLNMVPQDHPFLRAPALEEESNRMLTQIVTLVFTSNVPDLVMATVNALSTLAKTRAHLAKIIFEAMASWTPAALSSLPHTQVRNVEKTVRVLYFHFLRNNLAGPYASMLAEALEKQKQRMEEAARVHIERKEAEMKRKREQTNENLAQSKRLKVSEKPLAISVPAAPAIAATTATSGLETTKSAPPDAESLNGAVAFRDASLKDSPMNPLASFDVKTLPAQLVIDLIIANLQALSEADLQGAISRIRNNLDKGKVVEATTPQPPVQQTRTPALKQEALPSDAPPTATASTATLKAEPAIEDSVPDPLKMDIGEDDLAEIATPPRSPTPEEETEAASFALVGLENFSLAPPEYLSTEEADMLIKETITKMLEDGTVPQSEVKDLALSQNRDQGPKALWAMLITRLATRGFVDGAARQVDDGSSADAGEHRVRSLQGQSLAVRKLMLDFLKADFTNRIGFAAQWLAEEWLCDRVWKRQGKERQYPIWLEQIIDSWLPSIDGKNKSLASFLSELPEISSPTIRRIHELCLDKTRMTVGLSILGEMCATRPPCRLVASELLLGLTRAEDKAIRAKAIISVKTWASQSGPLEAIVLSYARASLKLLTRQPEPQDASEAKAEGERGQESPARDGVNAEEGDGAPAAEGDEMMPKDEADVLRFVELPFALCVKVPDMLDEIFQAFPKMQPFIQEAVKKHIAMLIRALGPNNAKLLMLLRTFPPGADSLALCVFTILTEKGRTPTLVALVKGLVEERDVDPRFLVPIMPDLDKAEIMKKLPKVVTILSSKAAEDRSLVKSVFQSIVTTPPQGFGSVSSNLPRVRQTELLTPVELMGLLHQAEKEIGLKNTVAAIQICFSMTDVFRSEVLGAVLNQILEEPNLPVLFMRTSFLHCDRHLQVIMAVSTYKSLSGYVSKNLLSRLITKKIWQNPPLWDGFILCAKLTAPSSFGALIQLPKEQLREVVSRQPDLRMGLKEYLTKKAGGNRARQAAFLDLLGPDEEPKVGATEGSNDSGSGSPLPTTNAVQAASPSAASRSSTPGVGGV